MRISDALLPEFDQEMVGTRKHHVIRTDTRGYR